VARGSGSRGRDASNGTLEPRFSHVSAAMEHRPLFSPVGTSRGRAPDRRGVGRSISAPGAGRAVPVCRGAAAFPTASPLATRALTSSRVHHACRRGLAGYRFVPAFSSPAVQGFVRAAVALRTRATAAAVTGAARLPQVVRMYVATAATSSSLSAVPNGGIVPE
jgi:hypothetical protein